MLEIATRTRTGDLVHARRECNPLLYRGFLFKLMNYQIYIIHSLNLDRKTLNLTFKIDPNKMVKQIKGVANLFMLYRLSNVWKLLLMLEQIRALRPGKKVNLATEEGCLGTRISMSIILITQMYSRQVHIRLSKGMVEGKQ